MLLVKGLLCFALVSLALIGGFRMKLGKSLGVAATILFVLPVALAVVCSFLF